jgi:DNA-binding MarR family transcriptional regulator
MTTTTAPTHETFLQRLADPDNPINQHATTWSERLALLHLSADARNGTLSTMSELGVGVCMSKAAITAMVDRLESAGLVMRQANTADRRVSYVVLTEVGLDVTTEALWHCQHAAAGVPA